MESFGKKHDIAQVEAQLQAQVKEANLSRKHKNYMLNELQIRGQAFRDDWYEVEPIVLWRFFSQTCNLPPNPHILTSHRSTAELRVVGIETSRTESLTEEPTPDAHNIDMSRLRIRERHTRSCVGLAPSLNVCSRNLCGSTE